MTIFFALTAALDSSRMRSDSLLRHFSYTIMSCRRRAPLGLQFENNTPVLDQASSRLIGLRIHIIKVVLNLVYSFLGDIFKFRR